MFYSSQSPCLRRQGVTFALVLELFSNVSKVSGAQAHLLNCYVFRQTSADTCTESYVHEEATHEKHLEIGGPWQKASQRSIRETS